MLVVSVKPIDLSLLDLFFLNLVGMYYNFFAPSTVGGDVLQAETAKRYIGGRMHSYTSIILNRVIALFAVVVLAVLFIAAGFVTFAKMDIIFIYISCALSMLMLVVLFGYPYVRSWIASSELGGKRAWALDIRNCILEYLAKRTVIWDRPSDCRLEHR
jgi:hypothetical protein